MILYRCREQGVVYRVARVVVMALTMRVEQCSPGRLPARAARLLGSPIGATKPLSSVSLDRRAAALAGRKPSKQKRSVGRPAMDNAAVSEDGPGSGETGIDAS